MRDVGILIWVVFLIVGVVGSMVSSARRQVASRTEAKSAPQGARVTSFVVPVTKSDTASSARSALLRQLSESQPFDSAQGDNNAARQRLVQTLLAQVQGAAPAAASPPAATAAPPAPPRPPPPRPAPAQQTERAVAPEVPRPRQRSLFGTGSELVRAVIAAEVLGKPRGINDEYR